MGTATAHDRAVPGDQSHLRVTHVRWLTLWLALLTLSGCSGFFRWDANHAAGVRVEEGAQSYYVVAEGDTLYSIAFQAGKDYRQLAQWNGIRWPYRIYPDQKLRLTPSRNSARSLSNTASKQHTRSAPRTQTAKRRSNATSRAAPTTVKSRQIMWQWPTYGPVLNRYSSAVPGRNGLEIGGKLGQPVRTTAAGRVVYSGSGLRGYGKLIIVKHDDVYLSAYGHNRRLLVKEGETLKAGQVIAELGDTGASQPKLHFEIRRNGEPIDPQRLLPKR